MVEKLKSFNWVMFLAMIALIIVGTIAIWSSGGARSEVAFHGIWKTNLFTAVFALVLYFVLAFTDYRRWLPLASLPMYAGALLMLVLVLCFGAKVYGGKRWLWFFQPSEIAKLCVISLVAVLLGKLKTRNQGTGGRRSVYGESQTDWQWLKGFRGFLLSGAVVGVPCLLILFEPDLGTTLALVPAAVVMMLAAGVWKQGLLTLLAIGGIAGAALLGAVHEAEREGVSEERRAKILKYIPLKEHQLKRVRVFLFPEQDQMGAGYNLRQSLISIGSGGLTGKGLGRGETNHLKYLPQSISMNDFIFCVYAEETGFVGSIVLLALMGMLILPCVWTAVVAGDLTGRLLALGVGTLLFAHVYINIAMSVGLVPITGLPLPFISAGRTFLVTVIAALGLVQSVSIHRLNKE